MLLNFLNNFHLLTYMKIAMVSVLAGRGEGAIVSFLKEHYGFKDGPGEIQPAMVDYESIGGYLAHILRPDKNTGGGVAYVFEEPRIDVLDYSNPIHSEDIVLYPGKVALWRATLHFIGEEDKLSSGLKEIMPDLKKHFGKTNFVYDLETALQHWQS